MFALFRRTGLFWRVLPIHLLIAALFVLPLWQRHAAAEEAWQAGRAARAAIAARHSFVKPISGHPVRIVLPRLAIDIPVVDGTYDSGQKVWSVAATTANYATITAAPNTRHDKTLVYGHWTPRVFGATKDLQAGDLAYLYTSNGHIFEYRYENNIVIKPTDVEIFNDLKGKPGLALMTCQGTWAGERRMMFFNLEGAK